MSRRSSHSKSPFYDMDFAVQSIPRRKRGPRKKKPVPITTTTLERWICDRCGVRAVFPDEEGHTALEAGWLQLDLTRSLAQGSGPYLFGKNIQVLCPADVTNLRLWFEAGVPGQEQDKRAPTRPKQHMSWVGD